MTVLLPSTPSLGAGTPRPVDGGSWQQPIAGGTTTRIERPGASHLAFDFTTPRIPLTGLARVWLSRLLQAVRQPARVAFPQPEIDVGTPGPAVVNGAGQGGYALAIRGATVGYTILEGQALNLYDAVGRAYLHLASANVTVANNGTATIPIEPMIRAAPSDGSACNLAAPVIEGRLIGVDKGLTLQRAKAGGLQLTIEELR